MKYQYFYAFISVIVAILAGWQLYNYVKKCEKFAKLDISKSRLKKAWLVKLGEWMFGWLCIAFLGFCGLVCLKGVLYIAHINGWAELLPLVQLDIIMIIFMLFTRNCLTTLTIIIQIIEEIEVKWRDYFHLGLGYTIFLIVMGYPMFGLSFQIVIVFIVDLIIYIIYQLEWAIILESLKGIGIKTTMSGGRYKILRVIFCMVPPINTDRNALPYRSNPGSLGPAKFRLSELLNDSVPFPSNQSKIPIFEHNPRDLQVNT